MQVRYFGRLVALVARPPLPSAQFGEVLRVETLTLSPTSSAQPARSAQGAGMRGQTGRFSGTIWMSICHNRPKEPAQTALGLQASRPLWVDWAGWDGSPAIEGTRLAVVTEV